MAHQQGDVTDTRDPQAGSTLIFFDYNPHNFLLYTNGMSLFQVASHATVLGSILDTIIIILLSWSSSNVVRMV